MSRASDIEVDDIEVDVERAWSDALAAAALLAVDPLALGGIAVRGGAGPVRDMWLSACQEVFPDRTRFSRMPAQIEESRLLGGLDLAATLRLGRPVYQPGLLSEADGGVVIAPMAERISVSSAAFIAAGLDRHEVTIEREGISARSKAGFALLAIDESATEDERLSPVLADRLAFHIDLSRIPFRCAQAGAACDAGVVVAARRHLASPVAQNRLCPDQVIAALVSASMALGIDSIRAPLMTLRAARAAAAIRGASDISDEDVQLAARLVLGPRATQVPLPPQERTEQDDEASQPPGSLEQKEADNSEGAASSGGKQLEDVVLDAAAAALPRGLLAQLAEAAAASSRRARSSGQSGPARRTQKRGRPIGVGRGEIGRNARLAIVDTLRAAAPWQRLRCAALNSPEVSESKLPGHRKRIEVRPEDFRFRRYAERSEALTIFVVDASGSTALHRLGEAKGAVELLLAECYVRRDFVAMVALRGREAELILPPTRALARAKRDLAGLPGGGGTPLASGIDKSLVLALAARRRDQCPRIVILTDGAANVARDGRTGRRCGEEDALAAGRKAVAFGVPSMLIDTGPRPSPFGARLAETLRGRYFALPLADAKMLSAVVKSATADV